MFGVMINCLSDWVINLIQPMTANVKMLMDCRCHCNYRFKLEIDSEQLRSQCMILDQKAFV